MNHTDGEKGIVLLPISHVDHGNINELSRRLGEGFEEIGLHPVFIDMRDGMEPAVASIVEWVSTEKVRIYVTVNALGFPHHSQDLFKKHDVKLFFMSLDHPCYVSELIMEIPTGTKVGFPTASNISLARNGLRKDIGYHHVLHASHVRPVVPWSKKDIPIFLVGNLEENPAMMKRRWKDRGNDVARVLNEMETVYRENPLKTLEEVGAEALRREKQQQVDTKNFLNLLALFDRYNRSVCRKRFLDAIPDLPVTVVGNWDGYLAEKRRNAHFVGPVDSAEVAGMIGRSKIVLDVLPTYYGSHERVFAAMASGSVAATTAKNYPDSLTKDGGLIELDSGKEARDELGAVLENEAAAQEIVAKGLAVFRAGHSWTDRAYQIWDAVENGDAGIGTS